MDPLYKVVLDSGPARTRGPIVFAVVIAVTLHLLLWLWSTRKPASLESWSAEVAARIHGLLGFRHVMELEQKQAEAVQERSPEVQRGAHAPRPGGQGGKASVSTPAAAQAGKAVSAPVVDLTAADVVPPDVVPQGKAAAYAGGTTAATGKSAVAVNDMAVDPTGAAQAGEPSQNRPVGLADTEWRCPWPSQALANETLGSEQVVMLRVVVGADARFESAQVLSSPDTAQTNLGFGEAALRCAKQARYLPATDKGQPIRALSPPIRVRFVR